MRLYDWAGLILLWVRPCKPRAVRPICPYPHSASLVMSWGLYWEVTCPIYFTIITPARGRGVCGIKDLNRLDEITKSEAKSPKVKRTLDEE